MVSITVDNSVAIVEDIRYQHQYHPVELSQRSPALAVILDEIKAGRFGDASVYEPYGAVLAALMCPYSHCHLARLVNTIRAHDHYLVGDDFDSCESQWGGIIKSVIVTLSTDLEANKIVDEAYLDQKSWTKKCIRTGDLDMIPNLAGAALTLFSSCTHGQI